MRLLVRIIFILSLLVCFNQCIKVQLPDLGLLIIKFVTAEGIKCQSYISNNGGAGITERGFMWKAETEAEYNNKKVAFDNGTNQFETIIFGLTPGTTYTLKAYVINTEGTSFSEEKTITTSRKGTFTNSRDTMTYKWVEINDQIWMADNLAYMPYISTVLNNSGIFVYNYKGTSPVEAKGTREYKTYGCFYEVKVSNYVCPDGWHLPSEDEWESLEIYLGITRREASWLGSHGTNQADYLKEAGTSHWLSPNDWANNCTCFSALPGGLCTGYYISGDPIPVFGGLGSFADFLSNESLYEPYCYWELSSTSRCIYKDFAHYGGIYYRAAYSIRCVKD